MNKLLEAFAEQHETAMRRNKEILTEFPWAYQPAYAAWCGQFYFFVCHATRLLAASASRLGITKDDLHIRFLDHMQEEKHHEKLFERDLQAMGHPVEELKEWPITSQLYQSQYYLVEHESPMALLGNIFYLEGMSIYAGPEILSRTLAAHGSKACSFMKVHVSEDTDHIAKATNALAKLNEEDLTAVQKSHAQTAYLFERLMDEIVIVTKRSLRNSA